MSKCKHEKVDTNILYKESVGTCNCCGEVVKFIKVPTAEYEKLKEFYERNMRQVDKRSDVV